MQSPHYRYYIELQPTSGEPVPRHQETQKRRETALAFIETMHRWLEEKQLSERVSGLSITMLGQVQITCDSAVINFIRNTDDVHIAAIRQAATYAETPTRWCEAH